MMYGGNRTVSSRSADIRLREHTMPIEHEPDLFTATVPSGFEHVNDLRYVSAVRCVGVPGMMMLMRSALLVALSLHAASALSPAAQAKDDVCITKAREIIKAMQAGQNAGKPYTAFRNQLNCDATKLQPADGPDFCRLAAKHDKWGASRGVEVRKFAGCRNAQNPPVQRCRELAEVIAGIMEERAAGSGTFLTRLGITYDQDCVGIAGHRIIDFMGKRGSTN